MTSAKERALAFPMDRVLEAYLRTAPVSKAEARRRAQELKRYLVLRAALEVGPMHTPMVLDELWHVFLLHTREYTAFCDALGKGFIHHEPGSMRAAPSAVEDAYSALLSAYRSEFQEAPPLDVWPVMGAGAGSFKECDAALEAQAPPVRTTYPQAQDLSSA